MRHFCYFAILAAYVSAADKDKSQKLKDDASKKASKFADWSAKYGKNYDTVEKFTERSKQFDKSKIAVEDLNTRALSKGLKVSFDLNETSDLTEEEYLSSLGLVVPATA